MSKHTLDDLLRPIDPANFSEAAHGAGHRVVVSRGKATFHKPGLLGRFTGSRADRHVFVKRWSVPKEVKDWTFRWSEGTTDISLDFGTSLVIQANEDVQALRLAETLLCGPEAAGEVLYGLIAARLHQELAEMLRRCDSQELSLLDEFRRSTTGMGESDGLNRVVSEAVAAKLGGALFRIGFQLKNIAPMQVEVRCEDTFTLADAKDGRKARTTALLELDNYQAYKKSGLETEAAVRETVVKSISQAVKQLLFARRYYAVVNSFTQGADSIASQMEQRIQAEARTIGYRVKLFQTFPDIAALDLLQPKRIEISHAEEKYALFKSMGHVQVAIVLSVQVASDFSKLHLLIDPDAPGVVAPISARVRQICRDTLQRFDHKAFNLSFDSEIVPELRRAIVEGLASHGLAAEVISIRDEPTEDASRFKALRGRTMAFEAEISPQADLGDGDPVPVAGVIEVVDLATEGWAQFEGKDYGYREDTPWTLARLRQLAQVRGIVVPDDADRTTCAVELELADIKDRVVKTLEGAMAKGPDLAKHWRDWHNSQEIERWARELAERAVAQEFGLAIQLRAFRRLDTQTETTLRIQRQTRHELLRKTAVEAAQNEIAHQQALDELVDQNQLERLRRHGQAERQALTDESDPQHEAVRQQAAVEAARLDKARRSVSSGAEALLPAQKKRSGPAAPLPWRVASGEPDRPGDGGLGLPPGRGDSSG